MQQVSLLLSAAFILTTLLTVGQLYKASNRSKPLLLIITAWMVLQLIIGITGFYLNEMTRPPRFILLALPPVAIIVIGFTTTRGQRFIDSFQLNQLTLLHTIRIAIEVILYFLFLAKAIPEVMTFSGFNFDIIAGLSAPMVYYIIFVKGRPVRRLVIWWNIICLGLLLNIVVIAFLSVPTAFQQFGSAQPNIAILYFPFIWLPAVIVPIVLFSHLVALRQLFNQKN